MFESAGLEKTLKTPIATRSLTAIMKIVKKYG
jgi:hypothetical protein